MLARLRPRLTFANVCSFLALLIALGTGSAYAANTVFSEDIVNGEVKQPDIGTSAVTGPKIRNGNVANVDLAANAVDSAKVVDESLTSNDLGTNSVNATEVADNSIDSGEIVNDSLFDSDLAPASVRTSEILDGTVGNADLANNAVNGAKVANNSLTTADIAGADVNGGHLTLAAGSVANGRCKQFASGNAGAQAGEAAILSTKGALQNGVVIYAQRVPSDGVVTLDVCNFSGTTQAAFTDLPVRVITFG